MGTSVHANVGAKSANTLTIADNDEPAPTPSELPTVEWALRSQTRNEGAGTAIVRVKMSDTSDKDVTVPFTLSGSALSPEDYTAPQSPLVIPAGSRRADLEIELNDDEMDEFNERVNLTLGEPENAQLGRRTVHTLWIRDNDPLPLLTLSASEEEIDENGGKSVITVHLSEPSGKNVTAHLSYSDSASKSDFSSPAKILIPAEQESASVDLLAQDDDEEEDDEKVVVSVRSVTNAREDGRQSATVSIMDDDEKEDDQDEDDQDEDQDEDEDVDEDKDDNRKVTICHKGTRTLSIANPALKAHLNHGDSVGACKRVDADDSARAELRARIKAFQEWLGAWLKANLRARAQR